MSDWYQQQYQLIEPEKYKKRVECLVDTYNDTLYYGQKIDGRLTLVENICDHGAVRIAWDAWPSLDKN